MSQEELSPASPLIAASTPRGGGEGTGQTRMEASAKRETTWIRIQTGRRFEWSSWCMHFLFFMVGIAPWLLVNSLFMELPIFNKELPEGTATASYLVVFIQLGNVLPFLYVVLQQYTRRTSYTIAVASTLASAIALSILIALFWDKTSRLAGNSEHQQHSVALWLLTSGSGLVGCFSVVTFFPLASLFQDSVTSALSTGLGLTALLPVLLALIQNPGGDPRFHVDTFFYILSGFLGLSFGCFLVLWFSIRQGWCSSLQRSQLTVSASTNNDKNGPLAQQLEPGGVDIVNGSEHHRLMDEEIQTRSDIAVETTVNGSVSALFVLRRTYVPLFNQVYICFINYLLMGINPYALSGYKASGSLLMWLSIATSVSGAAGRFASMFFKTYNLIALSTIQTVFWLFVFVLCFFSSNPPIPEHAAFLIIIANAIFSFLNGYEDTIIFIKAGRDNPTFSERACRFVAVANQLGALLGSFLAFGLTQLNAL